MHSLTHVSLRCPPCWSLLIPSSLSLHTATCHSHLLYSSPLIVSLLAQNCPIILGCSTDISVASHIACVCPSQTTWRSSYSSSKLWAYLHLFPCGFLCPEDSSSLSLPDKILLPFRGSVQMSHAPQIFH